MPKKATKKTTKKATKVETPDVVAAEVEVKEEKPTTSNKEAVIFDERKNEVRVYTKEKHGTDFEALANSFVHNPKRAGYTVELR